MPTDPTPPAAAQIVEICARVWRPYAELEAMPWDQRPGRIFARFTGWCQHSGAMWAREHADLVWTRRDEPWCISPEDRKRVMAHGGMDGIDGISGWMPATMMLGGLATIPALTAAGLSVVASVEVEVTDAMTDAAMDAADGWYEIDGDKGPWLRSQGFAAAFHAMIRTAGLALAPREEWRPIESAPKDGTRVQLYRTRNYAPGVLVHDVEIGSYVAGDWEDAHGGLIDQPTHWRPLPPPPEGV